MGTILRAVAAYLFLLAILVVYAIAAAIIVGGGVIEATMGIDSEKKNLEDIAAPLSAA